MPFGVRAGDASSVSGGSKLFSSFDNPSEHVGSQIAGGAGWRAFGVSGGMAGHWTGVGGGETLLQALASIDSASAASIGKGSEAVSFMVGLLLRRLAALGFSRCGRGPCCRDGGTLLVLGLAHCLDLRSTDLAFVMDEQPEGDGQDGEGAGVEPVTQWNEGE